MERKRRLQVIWNQPRLLLSLLDLDESSTGAVRREERFFFLLFLSAVQTLQTKSRLSS